MEHEARSNGEGPLVFHLIELRRRIIRSAAAVLIVFLGLAPFSSSIFDVIAAPMLSVLPQDAKMIATGVITPFLIPVKVSLLLAFLIVLPYVLHQTWSFVVPALYEHERRLTGPLLALSCLLFFMGMAFCYFVVFGMVFQSIYRIAPQSISIAPDIESYYSFVMTMLVAFGLAFEVPVAVMVLVRMGLVSLRKLREVRRYVIVGSFVVAAIVTPPDVLSQLLLAVPLCLLYEAGLLAAAILMKWHNRESNPAD